MTRRKRPGALGQVEQRMRDDTIGLQTEMRPPRTVHNGPLLDLEAFAVDDAGSGLLILRLLDPHALEGTERRQDGSTDPEEQ